MHPLLIAAIAVSAAVLVLFALWLFLIAPRARKREMRPFLRPYAHRGLWGEGIPENSVAAFRHAAEHGFAIELDVQLSSDGTVMVFHDRTLTRMCGREEALSSLTADELTHIPLNGTNETIPTFRAVLDAVAGRVPLLIELKGESADTSLVAPVLALLADYEGEWCMESFNPFLLRAVKKQAPHVVRGLLSTHMKKSKNGGNSARNFLLSAVLLTFLCRPAFHAYDHRFPKRLGLQTGLRLFGAANVVYTVRDERIYNELLDRGITPIFEGFVPSRREVEVK